MIRWTAVAAWWGLALLGISLPAAVLWRLGSGSGSLESTALGALAMFAPLVATVVLDRVAPREPPLRWRPRVTRWVLVGSAVGLAIPLLALTLTPALPGAGWDLEMQGMFERYGALLTQEQAAELRRQLDEMPIHPLVLGIPQAIVAGLTINALFAFGEEIGWRGWLLRELGPLGFWRASAVTGVLWGLWHAPLILQGHNYPEHPVAGVALFTVVCVGLSPLHAWVRLRGDTVWAAAVLHGTLNAAAGLAILVARGSDLLIGVPGLAGLLALIVLNGLLFLAGPRLHPTARA